MKPILFNTDMVKAMLSGQKTETRRVINPRYRAGEAGFQVVTNKSTGQFIRIEIYDEWEEETRWLRDPYKPGDILYVRERWRVGAWSGPGFPLMAFDYADGTCGPMVDLADRDMFLRLVDQSREDARKANCVFDGIDYIWDKGQAPTRWRPSIHMPKEAARLFLRVTDVRVERLQDITDEGAKAEGANNGIGVSEKMRETAIQRFQRIWDSTIPRHPNKFKSYPYRWSDNPWVWVIKFERCEKPEEDRHGKQQH